MNRAAQLSLITVFLALAACGGAPTTANDDTTNNSNQTNSSTGNTGNGSTNNNSGGGASNSPPSVNAGSDSNTAPNQTTSLNGVATDSDGSIVRSEWRQVSGPSVTITDASMLQTNFTAPNVTSDTALVFELSATDNDEATSSDQVTITVIAPSNNNNNGTARALWNGPIISANVSFYKYPGSLTTPVHSSRTSSGGLQAAGFFDSPANPDANALYLVKIEAGGQDLDRDFDGQPDSTPSTVMHDFHVLLRGDRLDRPFTVTPVSELLYRRVALMLHAGYDALEVEAELNRHTAILLHRDVNNDGSQNSDDLLTFADTQSGNNDLHESLGAFRRELNRIYESSGLRDRYLRHFTDRYVGRLAFAARYDDVRVQDGFAFMLLHEQFDNGELHSYDIGPADTDHAIQSVRLDTIQFDNTIIHQLDVDQDIALIAGQKTSFVDISDPSNMQIVATLDLNSVGVDIADGRGYVIEFDGSSRTLRIYDLATPTAPQELGNLVLSNTAKNIIVRGNLAYTHGSLSNRDNTFQVLDVSNPAAPTLLGSVDIADNAYNFTVAGNHAYAAGENLHIIDISNPNAPTVVGSHKVGGLSVFVRNNMAYLTSWGHFTGSALADYVITLDVSDPTRPQWVGNSLSEVLVIDNTTASSISQPVDLDIESSTDVAITAGDDFPGKVDISAPSSLAELGREDFHSNLVRFARTENIAAHGDFAYVAESFRKPRALNISDPRNPRLTNTGSGPNSGPNNLGACNQVHTQSGVLYAECSDNINTYSLTSPSEPEWLRTENIVSCFMEIQVRGDRMVTACRGQLDISDVSTASAPTLLGSFDYNALGQMKDFDINGDHIYVLDSPSSTALNVVSMSSPSNPQQVGNINLPDEIDSFRIQSDLITYCTTDDEGNNTLRILQFSSPTTIVDRASHPTPTGCTQQKVVDDLMILGGGPLESGITVLDISDLQNISTLGFYPVLFNVNSLEVHNGLLLTTEGQAGVGLYRMPNAP